MKKFFKIPNLFYFNFIIYLSVLLFLYNINLSVGGCSDIEHGDDCEAICSNGECEIRVVVILPEYETVEASITRVKPVLLLVEEKIKEEVLLPSKIKIKWIYYDDRCDASYATIRSMDAYTKDCAHFILGPSCEFSLAAVGRIVKYFRLDGMPLITPGGYTHDFVKTKTNCSDEFFMLVRTGIMSYRTLAEFTISLFKHYGWTRAYYFYDRNGHYNVAGSQTCHLLMNSMAEFHRKAQISYTSFSTDSGSAFNMTDNLKREVGLDNAIVIMCGNQTVIREIMLAAEEIGMVDSGEYVFFNVDLFSSVSNTTVYPWYREDDKKNNERAKKAYTAVLTVTAKQPDDHNYNEFSDRVKHLASSKYNYTFTETEPVSTFVTAFYDSILLFTYALNDTITEMGIDVLDRPLNGTDMVHRMWNRTFTGITGNVVINDNGDRVSDYSLLDMDPKTGRFEIVAYYMHGTDLEYVSGRQIHWAGGRTTHPPDKPVCGFDNSLCPDNSLPGYAILSMILGFAVVLMAIISILGYRHYRLEAEINSMTWRVNWNDVLPCNPNSKHRNSIHSFAKRGSQITVQSEDMGSLGAEKQVYIPIGFYKGNKVAIKRINVADVNLNRDLMLQLKKMKDLQHDHLVRFYGACVDSPDSCILTEYCPKGSLQDILENEQIKLDMMFKLSLMHDIVRGMHYLHTTDLHSHGSLKSSNCVVDSRFVLKITDFGLHQLRKTCGEQYEDNGSYAYWKKLLWTAPELLRMESPPPQGTQKGDIYSFGIIVHEIVTRQGTYYLGENEKSPQEIIEEVKNIPKPFMQPFRPKIDESNYDDINNMMVRCWSEEPTERPDFATLKSGIRKINRENESGNILDNLLKRMEMYANNLEFLVEERTQDYLEEKKKCEELLYQLLPRSVAAQLIMGQSVVAETYEQVTIYFSDIVGFTTISAESTPMQVVDLLNDLYTCFDSIVENFDVYKVETIGDAYMVVSGLPVRNGNLHAREISRMALALLKAVYSFQIRHRPNEQLRLRIGLHSGSCVAGVVGLKMPRYCLFGDTVNTASRMESNGEALKIHISETTKNFLDHFGSFITTERGHIPVKGKGNMLTYWLDGERPVDKHLPSLIDKPSAMKQYSHGDGSIETDPLLASSQVNGNINNNLIKDRKLNNSVNYSFKNLNGKVMNSISPTTTVPPAITAQTAPPGATKLNSGKQYKKLNNVTVNEDNIRNCKISSPPVLVKNY